MASEAGGGGREGVNDKILEMLRYYLVVILFTSDPHGWYEIGARTHLKMPLNL